MLPLYEVAERAERAEHARMQPSTPPPAPDRKRARASSSSSRQLPMPPGRDAPLPSWVTQWRWTGPVLLPSDATETPHPGHVIALWQAGRSKEATALGHRVLHLKRLRDQVWHNADLLRTVLTGTIGPATFLALSGTCKMFRRFLLHHNEDQLFRAAAMAPEFYTRPELCQFFCLPNCVASRLPPPSPPLERDTVGYEVFRRNAVARYTHAEHGLSACERLVRRRREWGSTVQAEYYIPSKKRRKPARRRSDERARLLE